MARKTNSNSNSNEIQLPRSSNAPTPINLPPLPVTVYREQYSRQHMSGRMPRGLERYPLINYWLDHMNILEGDAAGFTPQRFVPSMPCMETPDCHCGEE